MTTTESTYLDRLDPSPVPSPLDVRAIITAQAALCAAYPITDNPMLDAAVREVCAVIASAAGRPVDGTAVHDAFIELVDRLQAIHDIDNDPDGYLASVRLPRTSGQYDVTRGELIADREHWLNVLAEMAGGR